MLTRFGWTYQVINARQINEGHLGEGAAKRFHGLIMPGGYAVPRLIAINSHGKENIEKFIKGGGSYVGFCAGSYYASQSVAWAEESSHQDGKYNVASDYIDYQNEGSPDLFPGKAIGPFGWAAWNKGAVASGLEPAKINMESPTMKAIGMPPMTKFYYYGGPHFEFSKQPEHLEIWARAIKPSGIPKEVEKGADQATIVRFNVGQGKVILFSYHPLILIGGKINRVQVHDPVNLPVLSDDPGTQTLDEVNYHNWNIAHAAFKIASNQPVISMPRPMPGPMTRAKVLVEFQHQALKIVRSSTQGTLFQNSISRTGLDLNAQEGLQR